MANKNWFKKVLITIGALKNNYYFPQVRQYRKSDRFNVLRWWGYFFFLLLMDPSGCVTFFLSQVPVMNLSQDNVPKQ